MMNDDIKAIAYYLPQFHQIDENDEWWGEGFTEWTNVKKAKPVYDGHYQPMRPYEYYDLTDSYVMYDQIMMAKRHNLYGFCFHYYWFNGKRLLEEPIENLLADKSKEAEFPFMLCWANENWTRRWDGNDQDILIGQSHTVEDHYKVADDLIRYMVDDRYIKINNKPVLLIYRPAIIDEFNMLVDILQFKAKEKGFNGVHIVSTNSFKFMRNGKHEGEKLKINAIAEFPPHFSCDADRPVDGYSFGPNYNGSSRLHDYEYTVEACSAYYNKILDNNMYKGMSYYPGTFPTWDNTARKQNDSDVFVNTSAEYFSKWVDAAMKFTQNRNEYNEQFVFINAWNEWAEGAVLEPDLKNGYKHLETLSNTLSREQDGAHVRVKAFQIYYQADQKCKLLKGFTPHYNMLATVKLESGIIERLVKNGECSNCDWFGVFSWRAQEKIHNFDFNRLEKSVDDRYDVITLYPTSWNIGEEQVKKKHLMNSLHVEIWPVIEALLVKLKEKEIIPDKPILNKKSHHIYCNYFIAKKEVYLDYVNNLLVPAIKLLETDPELREMSREAPKTSYPDPPKRFTEHTGFKYYPHLPFVLERLINVYLEVNDHVRVGRVI